MVSGDQSVTNPFKSVSISPQNSQESINSPDPLAHARSLDLFEQMKDDDKQLLIRSIMESNLSSFNLMQDATTTTILDDVREPHSQAVNAQDDAMRPIALTGPQQGSSVQKEKKDKQAPARPVMKESSSGQAGAEEDRPGARNQSQARLFEN